MLREILLKGKDERIRDLLKKIKWIRDVTKFIGCLLVLVCVKNKKMTNIKRKRWSNIA